MSLAIAGRVVPITRKTSVASSESASFRGRVWIDDEGRVAAVTKSRQKAPLGFESTRIVDVGDDLVLPGFIDLHSHLAYATLPLWVEPGRTTPFLHHNIWPSRPTYAEQVTWPAYAFVTACPAELLAYAEVRALIGGTTSIQGSPPSNRPLDGWLVRNVEDERFGGALRATQVMASTLTLKPEQLGARAGQMKQGATFVYHCAEGQLGSVVAQEYTALQSAGCLQSRLIAIHTNALSATAYQSWRDPGTVVWSPFSNLWLYGTTTEIPALLARDVRVCIGSDWGPSGTRDVLGELKVAAIVSEAKGWGFSAFELVKMITANPGDALALAWGRTAGRLEPGALGDVAVVAAKKGAEPFEAILHAVERDVHLVVVGGKPLYGTTDLMKQAGATQTSPFSMDGTTRQLSLSRLDDPSEVWTFSEVLARMERVRANPKQEIEASRASAYRTAQQGPSGLRLGLDMPTGKVPIGGLPKDLSKIVVPPIQPIEHDAAFFEAVRGRGFHGGVLDELATYYS